MIAKKMRFKLPLLTYPAPSMWNCLFFDKMFFFFDFLLESYEIFLFSFLRKMTLFLEKKIKEKAVPPFFLKIVILYIMLLNFLRSLFKEEKETSFLSLFFIFLAGILILLGNVFPESLSTTISSLLIFGIYLLNFDMVGEFFSEGFLKKEFLTLSTQYFLVVNSLERSPRIFIRHFGRKAASLFLGKSGMTPTGKATLAVAGISGISLFINSSLQRRHEVRENQKNRDFQREENERQYERQRQENERQRRYDAWKRRHEAWDKSWIRGSEPQPPSEKENP